MQQSKPPFRIFIAIAVGIVALGYGIHTYKDVAKKNQEIEETNHLIDEFNECQDAADWKCAERALRALLEKTPDNQNLQLHLAGTLYEQERYEDCIAYIATLNYRNEDLEFLEKKSRSLLKEMEELGIARSMHFRVEFEGAPSRNDVLEALSVLEVAYDSLCHLFDFHPENKMHVVLYQSASYQGIGPRPEWVGAIFDGKLRIPVGLMQNREIYRPVLFHELTHAFIRAMTRVRVPLWLNEGVAQLVDGSRVDKERPYGPAPSLEALVTPFVGESRTDEAVKLYWYSLEMVKIMFRTEGNQTPKEQFLKFKDCIQDFRNKGVDESLREHYGVSSWKLWKQVAR
ncbi:MAG: tetratricopeptide repeat protein [Fibrobacter sp.]|nr:tetratricopeptide repeat protein [Fibrobacter sp.]